MEIIFNDYKINDNDIVSIEKVQVKPLIKYKFKDDAYYSLMVD